MTLGTRGDVQPFVGLCQALVSAGHEVVLCGPDRFAEFVTSNGVAFAGVDDGPMRQLDSPAEAGAMIQGGVRSRLGQARAMPAMFSQVLDDCWRVATEGPGVGADVIVHNGQILAGQHVGEALGIRAVLALPLPMYVPTRELPWPGQSLPPWWPATLNKATYAGMRLPALMLGRVVDQWRRTTLGLGRRRGRHDPTRRPDGSPELVLHAYSPAVLPRPHDWPSTATTTGYWWMHGGQELPADLATFLDAGPAPVFAGFGSMTGLDPEQSAVAVVEAVAAAGQRLVIAPGWGGLSEQVAADAAERLGVDLCVVGDVDFRRLFPRASVVVHHGGAGTTGTAFVAGRPQVVCPFVADQPFWARLAQHRGVAPAPLPQSQLTAEALAARLTLALSDETQAAAAAIGLKVTAEDGRARAIEAIEQAAAG